MEPNNDSCTDNCSPRAEEQTTAQSLATDSQHETANGAVAVQLPAPVSDSDSITEGTVLTWRELQRQLISSLLAEEKKKAFESKAKDTEQPTKGHFLQTKITKGHKKLSRDTNRHPAYARFTQRYQATSLQRRAQLLSAALQNAFRDIDSLCHRSSAPFIKSPAYIRQRLAAEFPPPVRAPVFPGYSTPLSTSRVSPLEPSHQPNLLFDIHSEPTTIPLADKERLQAFYASLPKEMASELAKMVELHAARAPADAIVSLVLRPLPEHLQVNGKRKFEVNLKYTKLVSASSSANCKRACSKTAPSTTERQSTPTKGTKRSASQATTGTAKKPKTEKPKKSQIDDVNFVLEKKHLLWPKKHIVHLMKNEHFSHLSISAIEKILRKAYQQYNRADLNNTAQPRWVYTSLRRLTTGMCRAIETAYCDKIALNEVLTLATTLSRSLIDDDNFVASKTTNVEIEARWRLFTSLETAIQSVFRNTQPTTSVHVAQIWSRIEKLLQTGSATSYSITTTKTTAITTTTTQIPTTSTSS
eukprot:TRINITY_DN9279_c0_g1_i1.p1 TRINITY_DN9279_c0_g1~~TRINITY_DN9279_c0_g1_i1.p1  ORF type:complete len:529 (+),score=88.57 TRINITY_DN9279_c0_g1_i1:454-2040(+)